MSYDWDKNCAIVDRLNYIDLTLKLTTGLALALVAKDLYFIKINYYAQKASKRLPMVILNLISVSSWLFRN